MKLYHYLLPVMFLLSSNTFSSSIPVWDIPEKRVTTKKVFSIDPLWEPSLPFVPEYDPFPIGVRMQLAIEKLIKSGKYSAESLSRLVLTMIYGQSGYVSGAPTQVVSLPPGIINEYGSGGSKQKQGAKKNLGKAFQRKRFKHHYPNTAQRGKILQYSLLKWRTHRTITKGCKL